ncbi:hypothetical protein C1645_829280 [Glomus cerebriforme]|uniref:Uncharacterized protein n=1 Tax=Glomus cerebriforme TaxID=658196 RepID=A0A397SUL1_9GLOM|nr:hypothetical protein C1645_829280 [Glomus cerebriforme]
MSEKILAMKACKMYKENFYVYNANDPLSDIILFSVLISKVKYFFQTQNSIFPEKKLLDIKENFASTSIFGSISKDLLNFISKHPKKDPE